MPHKLPDKMSLHEAIKTYQRTKTLLEATEMELSAFESKLPGYIRHPLMKVINKEMEEWYEQQRLLEKIISEATEGIEVTLIDEKREN